jgi:hypothetical protein
MTPVETLPATWRAVVDVAEAGLHPLTVRCGDAFDGIDMLVRGTEDRPKRGRPVAPGHAVHSIGAWPSRGIWGTHLGPNANGCGW